MIVSESITWFLRPFESTTNARPVRCEAEPADVWTAIGRSMDRLPEAVDRFPLYRGFSDAYLFAVSAASIVLPPPNAATQSGLKRIWAIRV